MIRELSFLSNEYIIQIALLLHDVRERRLYEKLDKKSSTEASKKSKEDIFQHIQLSNQHKNRVKYLDPLIEYGWIEMKFPDSKTHPKQRYKLTESGKRLLELIK